MELLAPPKTNRLELLVVVVAAVVGAAAEVDPNPLNPPNDDVVVVAAADEPLLCPNTNRLGAGLLAESVVFAVKLKPPLLESFAGAAADAKLNPPAAGAAGAAVVVATLGKLTPAVAPPKIPLALTGALAPLGFNANDGAGAVAVELAVVALDASAVNLKAGSEPNVDAVVTADGAVLSAFGVAAGAAELNANLGAEGAAADDEVVFEVKAEFESNDPAPNIPCDVDAGFRLVAVVVVVTEEFVGFWADVVEIVTLFEVLLSSVLVVAVADWPKPNTGAAILSVDFSLLFVCFRPKPNVGAAGFCESVLLAEDLGAAKLKVGWVAAADVDAAVLSVNPNW